LTTLEVVPEPLLSLSEIEGHPEVAPE
jgi:hypothetical protein